MPAKHSSSKLKNSVWIYFGFVLLTSFFTYFYRYNQPQAVFWDEPYHIASAEKYLNGVYFMEQHPPLGKLLIALGEKIVNANKNDSQFINTDYATGIEPSFSFAGYRLFPTLLAWLTAPVLFFIFFYFTKNPVLSALLSFLYIFDNAEIVHSRGAMVDAPLTFFGMLISLLFIHLQGQRHQKDLWKFGILATLFGVVFGLIMTTKVVGLIFILFAPAILWRLFPDGQKMVMFIGLSLLGFIVSASAVWQIHFSLGKKIVPELNNSGYYQASDEYKKILAEGKTGRISSFGVMMSDSLKYITFYNKGVPRLDLCKPDENGSPAYFWPFGARSINYRWEKTADGAVRYLYLQSNPIAWALGGVAVVMSGFLLLSIFLIPGRRKSLKHGYLLFVFAAMYGSYMIAILQLDRVMYLYHYFVPLLFSFILFGLVFINIDQIGGWKLDEHRKTIAMTVLGLLIFGAFHFYRPLSYYEPIKNDAFQRRSILPLWELTCVDCQKVSGLVVPRN
jgi:dolichyl-phosphate-mannose--protein O-mannosyl transferase